MPIMSLEKCYVLFELIANIVILEQSVFDKRPRIMPCSENGLATILIYSVHWKTPYSDINNSLMKVVCI